MKKQRSATRRKIAFVLVAAMLFSVFPQNFMVVNAAAVQEADKDVQSATGESAPAQTEEEYGSGGTLLIQPVESAEAAEGTTEEETEENTTTEKTALDEGSGTNAGTADMGAGNEEENPEIEEGNVQESGTVLPAEDVSGSETTEHQYFKDGIKVEEADGCDGYVEVVTNTAENGVVTVTVTPTACEGYEFMLLNLTDEAGYVSTPITKDYKRNITTWDGEKIEDGNYGYTFTIDSSLGSSAANPTDKTMGIKYREMPVISAYFDPEAGTTDSGKPVLLSSEMNTKYLTGDGLHQSKGKEDSVISWLGPYEAGQGTNKANYGKLHIGTGSDPGIWFGVDGVVNNNVGDYAVYYAGDGKAFKITSAIFYSRLKFTNDRFRGIVEGSNDGDTYEEIARVNERSKGEQYSIAREAKAIEDVKAYSYIRLRALINNADISLLKLYGNIVDAPTVTAETFYQPYKDGEVMRDSDGKELSYESADALKAAATGEAKGYDGYVEVVKNTTKEGDTTVSEAVTVTPVACEGYEFMLLNLTDESGYVSTPMTKDYKRNITTWDGEEIKDGNYSYTFTIDSSLESGAANPTDKTMGIVYNAMPKISVYFDPEGSGSPKLLSSEMNTKYLKTDDGLHQTNTRQDSVISWLGSYEAGQGGSTGANYGKLYIGTGDDPGKWLGVDGKKGDYAVYQAEDGKAFKITSAIFYSRMRFTDTRFEAKVEGSNDGTTYETICEIKKRSQKEQYSIAREVQEIEEAKAYSYIRLTATGSPSSDISLLKLYGDIVDAPKIAEETSYQPYKDGEVVKGSDGKELSYETVEDLEAATIDYEGYVEIKKSTVDKSDDYTVTATVYTKQDGNGKDLYDFMLLSLQDKEGNVTTPLSKDRVRSGANANKELTTGSDGKPVYTYGFKVDPSKETALDQNTIGTLYKEMPSVRVYFDRKADILDDGKLEETLLEKQVSDAKKEKDITTWLSPSNVLDAGKSAWSGKDIAKNDYAVYYAGKTKSGETDSEGNDIYVYDDMKAFKISGWDIYSRWAWSDTRFTAAIEASNDGDTWVTIFTTENTPSVERYSVARMDSAEEYTVRMLRIRAMENNTDVSLLKLYGSIESNVEDSELTELKEPGVSDGPMVSEEVTISTEVINGFTHPGIGITKTELENARKQVKEGKEPWKSYYNYLAASDYASTEFKCDNWSGSVDSEGNDVPRDRNYNSSGIKNRAANDGERAFTQAIMYIFTGQEVYRKNAMRIIRVWEQMDPDGYAYYDDAHIQTGYGLYRMIQAAELLKYTGHAGMDEELQWTKNMDSSAGNEFAKDSDEYKFRANVIDPAVETFLNTNYRFMNQHSFPLYGTLAAAIFENNRAEYEEKVEWTTVNSNISESAEFDRYSTGSIFWVFRWMTADEETGVPLAEEDKHIQLIEMGRDLAHAGDDVNTLPDLARMIDLQGTKVDPETGRISTSANAVSIYEFNHDAILMALDYFCAFDMGYDINWTTAKTSDKDPKSYYRISSDEYKGRLYAVDLADLYYVYRYKLGYSNEALEEKAPYYMKAFKEKYGPVYYATSSGESADLERKTSDGSWLYIPAETVDSIAADVPVSASGSDKYLFEMEKQYSIIDGTNKVKEKTDKIETKAEGNSGYIHVVASPDTDQDTDKSLFAIYNVSLIKRKGKSLAALRIKTDGTALLQIKKEKDTEPFHELWLPDTGGQWRNITFDMSYDTVTSGDYPTNTHLMYFNVIGDGTQVDFDHVNINAAETLSAPEFVNVKDAAMNVTLIAGTPYTFDFSATDTNQMHNGRLVYSLQGELPTSGQNAASIDSKGIFSWTPTVEQAGKYNAYVLVSDGVTISSVTLKILVGADRSSAIQAVRDSVDWTKTYLSVTVEDFEKAEKMAYEVIKQDGSDEDFYKALERLNRTASALEELNPELKAEHGGLDYTKMVKHTSLATGKIGNLADDNPVTFTGDLTTKYFTFDFGAYYRIKVESFWVQPRNIWPGRLQGCAIYGSVDGENWDTLTDPAAYKDEMQELKVKDAYKDKEYRYIKASSIGNSDESILSMGEFRIIGERVEMRTNIKSVSISTDAQALTNHIGDVACTQSYPRRALPGDELTLEFVARQEIHDVSVIISGMEVTPGKLLESPDLDELGYGYTASVILTEEAAAAIAGRDAEFAISYKYADSDGTEQSEKITMTTDGTSVFVSSEQNRVPLYAETYIYNISNNNAGTENKTQADIIEVVKKLEDGNSITYGDARQSSGSGSKGYIIIDFGENKGISLERFELLGRMDMLDRAIGTYIEGSNDFEGGSGGFVEKDKIGTWTPITEKSVAASDWQGLRATNHRYYRFIRLYNTGGWFGNLSEAGLFGTVKDKSEWEIVRADLENLIAEAKKLDMADYEDGAKKDAFLGALAAAEAGLGNETLSQDEIDALERNLRASMTALVEGSELADKEELQALVNEAKGKDLSKYKDDDAKTAFAAALEAAEAGLDDAGLTQFDANRLCEQLRKCMENLNPLEAVFHKITFNSMGGSKVESATAEDGSTAVRPADPVREGFVLRGWFLDEECTQVYDFTQKVTGDIILYAGWNIIVSEEKGMYAEEVKPYCYTGSAVKPQVNVYDGGRLLVKNRDYTLSYKNNVNASAVMTADGLATDGFDSSKRPKVIITGKGGYSDKIEIEFDICAKDINSEEVAISYTDAYAMVTGRKQQKLSLTIKDGSKKLKQDKDYTVAYYNADTKEEISKDDTKSAGNYFMRVSGKAGSNYCGSADLEFAVVDPETKTPMSKAKVTIASKYKKQPWSKDGVTLPDEAITVKAGKTKLDGGTDYTVEYKNNEKVGKAVLVVKAKAGSDYVGSIQAQFEITGTPLSKAKISGITSEYDYTGEPIEQKTVSLKYLDTTLIEDEDYTVSYLKNEDAGKATVVFTGINGYKGTVKKTYKIKPINLVNNSDVKVNESNEEITAVYTMKGATPDLEVKWNGRILVKDKDYTLVYANNKKVAGSTDTKAPSITVKGKGNFIGTLKNAAFFTITKQNIADAYKEGSLRVDCSDLLYAKNKRDNYSYNAKVVLYDNGKKVNAKDYIVSYTGNTQAEVREQLESGTAVSIPVTITAKDTSAYYEGSISDIISFRITPYTLKKAKLLQPIENQTYTGDEIVLESGKLQVKKDSNSTEPLVEGRDFVVVGYSNNLKAGSNAKVTIKGIGNYSGTATFKFRILKKSLK